jgi:hypothetical protein
MPSLGTMIVPQYTAGGQYPLSSAAALTGDFGIVITSHKTVEEQKRPSTRFARPWVVNVFLGLSGLLCGRTVTHR